MISKQHEMYLLTYLQYITLGIKTPECTAILADYIFVKLISNKYVHV